MARKQLSIPGTARKTDPDVEAAAERYVEARDERMRHSKLEKQTKLELIATMAAKKIRKLKFDDAEGNELLVETEEKVDVSVKRTGESDSPVGEGVSDVPDGSVPQGLIAQAMRDSESNGVHVTADGDVVVPETSAPKRGRGRPKKVKS